MTNEIHFPYDKLSSQRSNSHLKLAKYKKIKYCEAWK